MIEDRRKLAGISECERIEGVLREKLKLRKDFPEEELQKRIALAVTSIAGTKSALEWIDPRSPQFRKIGRRKAKEELRDKLAPKMKALLDVINTLHKPALDALSRAGSQLGVMHAMLQSELKIIRAVDLSEVPENPGRGRDFCDQPQRALSFRLAEVFLDLTGERPAAREKGRYGFHDFAHDTFRAMEIKPPSDRTLRDACAHAVAKK